MNRDFIFDFAEKRLTYKRKLHTSRVMETALDIAEAYKLKDRELNKIRIAVACHDMYRGISKYESNYYVRKFKLGSKYIDNLNLAHSKIAAYVMEHELEIDDEDILNAVKFHTTGRADMSIIEKILFLADAIEPAREYDKVDKIRKISKSNLDAAVLMVLSNTVDYLRSIGTAFIDEDTIEAKRYLEKETKDE